MEVAQRLRKPPSQVRTQERVARAIAAAEQLLLARGPEEVSIPEIAELSGVPRASLYQFFANKHQLFAAIAEQHLSRVAQAIEVGGQSLAGSHWRNVVNILVRAASQYYNQNPVAGILILGWPMSRASYLAQEVTIENIGEELRKIFETLTPQVRFDLDNNHCTIITELAFAVMKYGYYRDGVISDAIMTQATLAVIGYMEQILPPALTRDSSRLLG